MSKLDCPTNACDPSCGSVFDRVVVSRLIRGGTRVMWELLDSFLDPLPHTFSLEVGKTANNQADDWAQVGLSVTNVFVAVDGEQRVFGKTNRTHYRIKLQTSAGTYYSDPVGAMGTLQAREWRIAREVIRKERLRSEYAAQDGYLLKKRISGVRCETCLDHMTQEVRNPDCPDCLGTGFKCGYYYPMACVWADMSPKAHHVQLDGSRGTVDDVVVTSRMLMSPLMGEEDVWVNKLTDDRYYIHKVQHTAEIRGVPLVGNVEMRPAPFTDIVYDIEIPEQIAAVEAL